MMGPGEERLCQPGGLGPGPDRRDAHAPCPLPVGARERQHVRAASAHVRAGSVSRVDSGRPGPRRRAGPPACRRTGAAKCALPGPSRPVPARPGFQLARCGSA